MYWDSVGIMRWIEVELIVNCAPLIPFQFWGNRSETHRLVAMVPLEHLAGYQGPVVQKPVNVNPGLKFNRLLYFVMFCLTT